MWDKIVIFHSYMNIYVFFIHWELFFLGKHQETLMRARNYTNPGIILVKGLKKYGSKNWEWIKSCGSFSEGTFSDVVNSLAQWRGNQMASWISDPPWDLCDILSGILLFRIIEYLLSPYYKECVYSKMNENMIFVL